MKNGKLLDLYSDYLISAFGQTTATGLSALLNGEVSHDQVQRFLASKVQTSADLWRVVKPHVREMESAEGVTIVDDSIAEKPYTDENEIVCWRYDPSKQRSVKGSNFVTCLYHSQGISLPVGFEPVRKTERYLYLVTSDTTLDGNGIAAIYQKRWNVEPYPKSLKQNASLEKSPTQTMATQTDHFFAALCGYIKLELLKGNPKLNHFALKSKLYLSAIHAAYAKLRELNPTQLAA